MVPYRLSLLIFKKGCESNLKVSHDQLTQWPRNKFRLPASKYFVTGKPLSIKLFPSANTQKTLNCTGKNYTLVHIRRKGLEDENACFK